MSDSRGTYRVIKKAILQLYSTKPQGNLARHIITLVGLVSGIVLSKSCQLPKIASKVPGDVHPDSRTKQFSRWVNNETITFDLYFLPFIEPLLMKLATIRPLELVMDGSAVARGCVTLMVSVLYGGRALPVAWLVIAGAKGHFPAETPVTLVQESRRVSRRLQPSSCWAMVNSIVPSCRRKRPVTAGTTSVAPPRTFRSAPTEKPG